MKPNRAFAPGVIQGFKPEGRERMRAIAREVAAWLTLFLAGALVTWLAWQVGLVMRAVWRMV